MDFFTTRYIGGSVHRQPLIDRQITGWLTSRRWINGMHTQTFGIANKRGKVYRGVTLMNASSRDLYEFGLFVTSLAGMRDVSASITDLPPGVDTVFGPASLISAA
ncbi:hypothetical protein S7S_09265 [Isoalcanivorax pacificus W11-5]|uniref:Uncharacterized protein n=1 Tax=Isoalcanivorax pacificus W11-5 TaxID=391936 RepID=A0A0B4XPS9_9GAMM|nr:hypothetical protein [Isoalcanivorax pacificus]AJD48267.1 hypothetical protein S7S_09265 [Isoalcanivorax pacificus W11-5]